MSHDPPTPRVNALGQPIGPPVENWKPPARPMTAPLTGSYCTVERFDQRDADELFEAYRLDRQHRNWTYLSYGPFESAGAFADWTRGYCHDDDPLFVTVRDVATEKAVGLAGYLRIEPAIGSLEVGHINFSPLLQRTRASTEAMYLMMRHAFDLGYRRYEWKCDALNAPSRRAAERLGFRYEGTFRKATLYKGRSRDTAWFAVVDTDWPALRTEFERWLQPDNFDASGGQRSPLRVR